MAVHYAGVQCEMDPYCRSRSETPTCWLSRMPRKPLVRGISDAPAGNLGDVAAVSFHQTKNVICR